MRSHSHSNRQFDGFHGTDGSLLMYHLQEAFFLVSCGKKHINTKFFQEILACQFPKTLCRLFLAFHQYLLGTKLLSDFFLLAIFGNHNMDFHFSVDISTSTNIYVNVYIYIWTYLSLNYIYICFSLYIYIYLSLNVYNYIYI